MSIVPDIPAKLFSLSAVAVGYLLINDMTANEQNAVGNWLMLVAQVLCTNAYYKQVEQERMPNSNSNINGNDHDTLVMLKKMVKAMECEIENIKNSV